MPEDEKDERLQNLAELTLLLTGLGSLALFVLSKLINGTRTRSHYLPPDIVTVDVSGLLLEAPNASSNFSGNVVNPGGNLSVDVSPAKNIPPGDDSLQLFATAHYKVAGKKKWNELILAPNVNNGVITNAINPQVITFTGTIPDYTDFKIVVHGVEDSDAVYTRSVIYP